jgi:uncharacterized protein (DUF58 family)
MLEGLIKVAARDTAPAASPEALARVQPMLADLVAQGRRANALAATSRPARARQNGLYNAPLKGRGMEYAESRPYQAGDDVRALDWRLTARSGKPHTKLFREERERPVFIAIDLRPTMAFATRGVFKSVQAARAAALLAFKAVADGDRVGGAIIDAVGSHELPPGRGQVAVTRLLKRIVEADSAATDRTPPLALLTSKLQRLVKPGSLVYLLSDFRDLGAAAESDLGRIAEHSQVIALEIHDAFEQLLPVMTAPLRVAQGGASLDIALEDRALATAYRQRFEARRARLHDFCGQRRIGLCPVATTDDLLLVLQRAPG